jgi:hypothetical protein
VQPRQVSLLHALQGQEASTPGRVEWRNG